MDGFHIGDVKVFGEEVLKVVERVLVVLDFLIIGKEVSIVVVVGKLVDGFHFLFDVVKIHLMFPPCLLLSI
jgi:hypothetical protein